MSLLSYHLIQWQVVVCLGFYVDKADNSTQWSKPVSVPRQSHRVSEKLIGFAWSSNSYPKLREIYGWSALPWESRLWILQSLISTVPLQDRPYRRTGWYGLPPQPQTRSEWKLFPTSKPKVSRYMKWGLKSFHKTNHTKVYKYISWSLPCHELWP